jgi:SNF2 family DNA or RNA helicase
MLELYPFQQYTVDNFRNVRCILLGDDMGLGKTVQAIALDLHRRSSLPETEVLKTLVVAPLAVIPSWKRHWETMAPSLKIVTIDNKNRAPFVFSALTGDGDVFICHWPALRLMPDLAQIRWFHVIADEIHSIQNRKAKQTIALKKITCDNRTGLSGTPAFDKPDDLWSILNWLYPKYWSSYWSYYNRHIITTQYNGYRQIVGIAHIDELHKQMAGFYIRRKKEDVLPDLPDKYYTTIDVDLSPMQTRAYESMRKQMLAWVGEHEREPVSAPVVIAQLTRLQQFACAFAEIDEVTGKMILSEPSSKLDAVMDLIESTDRQIVVFSQFSQMIKLLGTRLDKAGIPHGLYIGDTSPKDRTKIEEDFQAGKLKVFAGTISAGGVGITLTASSTVIFIDRGWSPSINIQAEDRLHRIGQNSGVQVIDIRARGTIDARRAQRIQQKWSWIKKLIGDDDSDEDYLEFGEDENLDDY